MLFLFPLADVATLTCFQVFLSPEYCKSRERGWLNAEGAQAFHGHQWPSTLLYVIHNVRKINAKKSSVGKQQRSLWAASMCLHCSGHVNDQFE